LQFVLRKFEMSLESSDLSNCVTDLYTHT